MKVFSCENYGRIHVVLAESEEQAIKILRRAGEVKFERVRELFQDGRSIEVLRHGDEDMPSWPTTW